MEYPEMKVTLLGTGTPTPSLTRMSSSYLIEVGDDVILFDFGSGGFHRLMEAGIESTKVSHIFFSHLHYDHCLDYARLLLNRWDHGCGKFPELEAHGPKALERMTRLLVSPEGAFADDIRARTEHPNSIYFYQARGGEGKREWPKPNVHELDGGETITGKGWTIKATEVHHQQPLLSCLAYRIDTPEGSLTYSGDTGYPCPNLTKLAQGCDILIHMCHWISGTHKATTGSGHLEAAKAARDANVSTLVLSHFTNQLDVPGVREKILYEVQNVFKGNVIWGEDLMEIPLGTPKPGKLD